MLCSVCEAVNREENNFCRTCGARLARRPGADVGKKCGACGRTYEPGYRYCGQCGSDMEHHGTNHHSEGPDFHQASAIANSSLPPPETGTRLDPLPVAASVEIAPPLLLPRTPPEFFKNVPRRRTASTSTSFLGLGDRADVSYLLRDEQTSRHVLRKVVLLSLLAGVTWVAYFRLVPLYHADSQFVEHTISGVRYAMASGDHQKHASSTANGSSAQSAAANDRKPDDLEASSQASGDHAPATSGANRTEGEGASHTDSDSAKANPDNRQSSADAGIAKPSPAETAGAHKAVVARRKPSLVLVRAQQYLQGKGVPQNCEQGLVYLRAAALKNDPQAAVQMSALYASGHCVHQDRVTAYRWLSSAREQQPYDQWIQQNLDVLWGQMSPQERKQIIN